MARCSEWSTPKVRLRISLLRVMHQWSVGYNRKIHKAFCGSSKIILFIKGQMEIEELQKGLNIVGDWCMSWGMRLNAEKCKEIHFGKSNRKATYCITDVSGNENKYRKNEIREGLVCDFKLLFNVE